MTRIPAVLCATTISKALTFKLLRARRVLRALKGLGAVPHLVFLQAFVAFSRESSARLMMFRISRNQRPTKIREPPAGTPATPAPAPSAGGEMEPAPQPTPDDGGKPTPKPAPPTIDPAPIPGMTPADGVNLLAQLMDLAQSVEQDQVACLMLVPAVALGGWVLPIAQNILLAYAVCDLVVAGSRFRSVAAKISHSNLRAHTTPQGIKSFRAIQSPLPDDDKQWSVFACS